MSTFYKHQRQIRGTIRRQFWSIFDPCLLSIADVVYGRPHVRPSPHSNSRQNATYLKVAGALGYNLLLDSLGCTNIKENIISFFACTLSLVQFCIARKNWQLLPQIRKQICLETHIQYEFSILDHLGQFRLQRETKSKLP